MEKYIQFIENFKLISYPYVNYEILEKLKEEYKLVINSIRVFEQIVNINILLKVLEKRGILQYNEIGILKHISQQFIKNETLEQLISKYEQWLEKNSSKINNLYTSSKSLNLFNKRKSNICLIINFLIIHITQYHPAIAPTDLHCEKELQILIINKVGKKIGKHWADVCRNLNIEDSIIEEAEIKYFNETNKFEKMFNQVLNVYILENNFKWKNDLIQALELSRRKDLQEMVKEILLHNNS